MTATTIVRNALNLTLKGKGCQSRQAAFLNIAPTAYSEGMSRAAVVAAISAALGKTPTDAERAIAKGEFIIGRATARMPATELPKGMTDAADKLAHVRSLVELYAAPPKDGVAARKLRKGQLGRRTVGQQRVIRAGEEAWSQVIAECGVGGAQTQSEKNAKKRAPAMKGATNRGKASTIGTGVTHSELVKPEGPMTADAACSYIASMAATLLAFSNKHAKVVPTDHGTAIRALKGAIDKAEALRASVAS